MTKDQIKECKLPFKEQSAFELLSYRQKLHIWQTGSLIVRSPFLKWRIDNNTPVKRVKILSAFSGSFKQKGPITNTTWHRYMCNQGKLGILWAVEVASLLAFYYDDLSSYPTEAYCFLLYLCLKRTKIYKKGPGLVNFFINTRHTFLIH